MTRWINIPIEDYGEIQTVVSGEMEEEGYDFDFPDKELSKEFYARVTALALLAKRYGLKSDKVFLTA